MAQQIDLRPYAKWLHGRPLPPPCQRQRILLWLKQRTEPVELRELEAKFGPGPDTTTHIQQLTKTGQIVRRGSTLAVP